MKKLFFSGSFHLGLGWKNSRFVWVVGAILGSGVLSGGFSEFINCRIICCFGLVYHCIQFPEFRTIFACFLGRLNLIFENLENFKCLPYLDSLGQCFKKISNILFLCLRRLYSFDMNYSTVIVGGLYYLI